VTESAPLKVRPLRGEASIPLTPAFPPVGRPTEAAVIVKSLPPKVFDIWILILSAPIDMWSVCRTVASLKTALEAVCAMSGQSINRMLWAALLTNGEGGKLAVSTSWGIDVHVSTQWLAFACRSSRAFKKAIGEAAAGKERHTALTSRMREKFKENMVNQRPQKNNDQGDRQREWKFSFIHSAGRSYLQ
jgi:hypothetical protein